MAKGKSEGKSKTKKIGKAFKKILKILEDCC